MGYAYWPGAYTFKDKLGILLQYLKDEIDSILKKINSEN